MARVAGETADGCLTWLAPPEYLRRTLIPAVEAGATAAGRPRPRIVALVPTHHTSERADAARLVKQTIGNHVGRPHYRAMLHRAGVVRSENDDVCCDWLLDNVVAWGDHRRIRERLDQYHHAGADEIAVAAYPGGRAEPDRLARTWTVAAEALVLEAATHESSQAIRDAPERPVSPLELVETYVERVWNQGDLTFVDRCVRPDYLLHDRPSGDLIRGATGLKRHIAVLREVLPDLKMTVLDTVTDGDRVAWRWHMEGTHSGEGLGLAPSGRRIATTGMAIYRIEDGNIVERHGEADTLGLLTQLGVLRSGSGDDLNRGRGA